MQKLTLCLMAAVSLAACSNEPDYTDQQRVCIAKQYNAYDRKQLSQCVNVCQYCLGGNTVTCNTSCKLKGAS